MINYFIIYIIFLTEFFFLFFFSFLDIRSNMEDQHSETSSFASRRLSVSSANSRLSTNSASSTNSRLSTIPKPKRRYLTKGDIIKTLNISNETYMSCVVCKTIFFYIYRRHWINYIVNITKKLDVYARMCRLPPRL